MANETTPVISPIWCPIITEGRDIELPASAGNKRRIANLQVYCYDEMIKRLNGANQGKSGYFLRRLWKKHEDGLTMHANDVYGEQHEQYQKANRSEFEKKHRKGDIGFRKNGSGAWGVYSDWLYDTYQKDWSKAFQLTFYGFFRNIDYLSHNGNDKFFSHTRINPRFRYANPDGSLSFRWLFSEAGICQLGEVIKLDAENLRASGKLSAMQGLPKHDKAILYCILSGVYHRGRYPGEDMYGLGHDAAFWPSAEHDFLKCLASEAFAHIAAAAIVNANAFQAVKTYLPNVHGMFVEMLETLTLGLGECEVKEEYEVSGGNGGESSEEKYPSPPPLTEKHPFDNRAFFRGKRVIKQGFPVGTNMIISLEEGIARTYESYRNSHIIPMARHHLFVAEAANGNEKAYHEFTYVYPHFYNDNIIEVYQGFYSEVRGKPTMGGDFGKLLYNWKTETALMENPKSVNPKSIKPKLVIHIHPLRRDDRLETGAIVWKTMFSENDEKHIESSYDTLWIGIEPFFKDPKSYYVDTFVSIGSWGRNEGRIPAQHMERIEELTSKKYGNDIDIIKMKV